MNFIAIILGVLLVALLALYYLMKSGKFSKSSPPEAPDYPYIRESALLTTYEQSFHRALLRVLDDQYQVYPKVGLATILSIDPELPDRSLGAARERIEREIVDFALCERDGTGILGVIQLDPYTHQPDGRRRFDTFIDQALKAAGVPVVRMPIKENYSEQELRIEITRSLVLNWGTDRSGGKPMISDVEAQKSVRDTEGSALGNCPSCGSPLQVRQARTGKFAGKHLLACSRYPACKNIRLIKEDSAMLAARS